MAPTSISSWEIGPRWTQHCPASCERYHQRQGRLVSTLFQRYYQLHSGEWLVSTLFQRYHQLHSEERLVSTLFQRCHQLHSEERLVSTLGS